ncbi:MAG TPA: A/G-specific adenine glycosylase [Calditrichaeota bacterium]|nr:A/G-specific adenine glycosylase [Calditrichota bacterium]
MNTIHFHISKFRSALLDWFRQNKRLLPWRGQSHWYPVFLSEFLLQQTQVKQALPYYHNFIRAFPDIHLLAAASEEEILARWTGLGYYARARNLLKAAKDIVDRFNGNFPQNYYDALTLPGIGPYTAAAILSIAFNLPHAVVDGNVTRVLTRLFRFEQDIRIPSTRKTLEQLSEQLLDPAQPGDFNEAMMELGALLCKPRQPDCDHCPLLFACKAGKSENPGNYPIRSKLPEKRRLHHFVYLIEKENRLLLVRRPQNGLLGGMWEFPVSENGHYKPEHTILGELLHKEYGIHGRVRDISPQLQHVYSHLHLRFHAVVIADVKGRFKKGFYRDYVWKAVNEMSGRFLHSAHHKAWEWYKTTKS